MEEAGGGPVLIDQFRLFPTGEAPEPEPAPPTPQVHEKTEAPAGFLAELGFFRLIPAFLPS